MSTTTPAPSELPAGAGHLAQRFPAVWEKYAALGEACIEAGPLTARERRLVKLALSAGAALEGAVHSHTRRGLKDGLSAEDVRHLAVLAIPTLGLASAVRAMTWIEDILARKERSPK